MFTTLAGLLISPRRGPHRPAQAHIEVLQLEDRTVPAQLYWVYEGTDTNWSTIANWRVGSITGVPATAVPGAGDDVVFSSALPLSENPANPNNAPYMESSYNIASLTIENRPAQQYSLTLDGSLQITSSAQMDAGTLKGPGPMDLSPVESGNFTWRGGTIETTVNVNMPTIFTMEGEANSEKVLKGQMNVYTGNASWNGQGTFKIVKAAGPQDAIFHIDSGATFTINRQDANAQIDMTADAYFENSGTFNVNMGASVNPPWVPNKKLWFPGQGLVRNYSTMNVQWAMSVLATCKTPVRLTSFRSSQRLAWAWGMSPERTVGPNWMQAA